MPTVKKFFAAFGLSLSLLALTFSGCKDEEEPPAQTTYTLKTKDVLGVNGTVTFIETSTTQTTIEITLNGVDPGPHPAHIHANSAVETGDIVISLNPVDDSGKSSTVVTKLDYNTPINYTQLLEFDGYLNVHESESNPGVILAQGDIGGNELTGTNISYNLAEVNTSGVAGTALFEKRKNGNTLITLSLTGTINGDEYPAHIHLGSVTTVGGGPITVTFNDVDGTTGKSFTNVRELDNGTALTYDDLLLYSGYINVHESEANLASILCQGNIGTH